MNERLLAVPSRRKRRTVEEFHRIRATGVWDGLRTYLISGEIWELVVRLIGSTKTEKGLVVQADLDKGKYPIGVKVSDDELAGVRCLPDAFHGEWNYRIRPKAKLYRLFPDRP